MSDSGASPKTARDPRPRWCGGAVLSGSSGGQAAQAQAAEDRGREGLGEEGDAENGSDGSDTNEDDEAQGRWPGHAAGRSLRRPLPFQVPWQQSTATAEAGRRPFFRRSFRTEEAETLGFAGLVHPRHVPAWLGNACTLSSACCARCQAAWKGLADLPHKRSSSSFWP